MLLMSVSSNEGLKRAILWIYGDLSITDWSIIPYGTIFIMIGLFIAISRAKALNSLILGDDLAHSLGFSPRKERFILFVAVSLIGFLISSALHLLKIHWAKPISRVAEQVAIAAVALAGIIIVMDMGRPDRFLNIFLHGRFASPIIWDVTVV